MRAGYFLREASGSLWRGRWSTLLAIGTIALALFVLGAFVLVTSALDRLMAGWSATAEISVYLQDEATADQRDAVEAVVRRSGLTEAREFVSKDEAARRFRRNFPDLASAAEGLASNPFPASIEARLRATAVQPAELSRLARTLSQMQGVADVRYDRQWLERLARLVTALRWTGIALASALAVAAGLTIATVVRLAMFGRREEIEIMKLVGAPLTAIRGPFVVEGILQGGIGAIVALLALRGLYEIVRAQIPPDIAHVTLGASLVQFLTPAAGGGILAGGMLVGCIGGYIATRVADR